MTLIAFNIAMLCYLAASLGYFVYLIYRNPLVSKLATSTVALGWLAHTVVIALRSQQTGHGPYTTDFEVAVFFSWLVSSVFFITHWKYKIKDLGSFVIPVAFLILLLATFLSEEVVNIPPTEFKVLLTLHRTLSILGYAAFAIAFAAGLMYLIQEKQVKTKRLGVMYFRMPSLEILDNLNSKVLSIGFPLFTLGFLTGVIWSLQTSQDKLFSWNWVKTWPLVVGWILYGAIFFGRMFAGVRGKKAAQGAVIGFFTIIFTYFLHV